MKSEEMYEYDTDIPYDWNPLYVYESHLGSLFTSSYILDHDETYCETCNDSDWLLGEASNRTEAWDLLKPHTDMFDPSKCDNCTHKANDDTYCYEECENYLSGGGYDLEYVKEFIDTHWDA